MLKKPDEFMDFLVNVIGLKRSIAAELLGARVDVQKVNNCVISLLYNLVQ